MRQAAEGFGTLAIAAFVVYLLLSGNLAVAGLISGAAMLLYYTDDAYQRWKYGDSLYSEQRRQPRQGPFFKYLTAYLFIAAVGLVILYGATLYA